MRAQIINWEVCLASLDMLVSCYSPLVKDKDLSSKFHGGLICLS